LLGGEIWRVGASLCFKGDRAMAKNVVNFLEEKVHPKRKSWLRLCGAHSPPHATKL